MNDLIYVGAAYAVVFGGLVAYAISLVRRGTGAARRLTTIEARRDRPPAGPEVEPAMEPQFDPDL